MNVVVIKGGFVVDAARVSDKNLPASDQVVSRDAVQTVEADRGQILDASFVLYLRRKGERERGTMNKLRVH